MGAVVIYRDCVARPLAHAPRDIVPVPPDGATTYVGEHGRA
jgi:hypothetical protein